MGLKIRAEEIYRPSEDKQHMKIAAERIQYVGVLCKTTLQTYLHPHDAGSPRMSENLYQSTRNHFPGDLNALRMTYLFRAMRRTVQIFYLALRRLLQSIKRTLCLLDRESS